LIQVCAREKQSSWSFRKQKLSFHWV
jgi:hypothetical protein